MSTANVSLYFVDNREYFQLPELWILDKEMMPLQEDINERRTQRALPLPNVEKR